MLYVNDLVKQFKAPSTDGETRSNGVDGVSFEVRPGELFTLLGPSGCGKTTTLRSIAGLEHPDSGHIRLGDHVLFDGARKIDRPANRRGLAMVFQSYAIWPHMSVFRNVAFPLEIAPRRSRLSRGQIRERVHRALDTVGLGAFAQQNATRLSGGQQQRLALARSLVTEPAVVLLDEPLSNLDAKLRESMRIELKRLQREMGLTAVYVTHDQAEALSMSSRVAIMDAGKLVQLGRPREIYGAPVDRFVADFLGLANFVEGEVLTTTTGVTAVRTDIGVIRAGSDGSRPNGEPVLLCLRPEHLVISTTQAATPPANELEGKLLATAFLGDRVDHVVALGPTELRVRSHSAVRIRRDAAVYLTIAPEDVVVLPKL
ncbi:MAG TPA: ABC transporter ATP-binding protein [Jatrophihabitantaceae bacterium]|jgi:iron(III) transport system ATP-binding protein